MGKEILDQIIAPLEKAPDFYLPIKLLWKGLKRLNKSETPSLDVLTALISCDERFVIEYSGKAPWEDSPDDIEQMESMGYYTGPKVRLKSRIPSQKDVEAIALKQAQKIIDNLVKAYESRPKDLPEASEAELLEAMKRAKKLKENLELSFKKGKNE